MINGNPLLENSHQPSVSSVPSCSPSLQVSADSIRNVCIIAHVDHGKTCLADCLVSSNGIISGRMAGKMRYMDSREDEQERGITMKTSAISLFYDSTVINVVDSPGHVDFSGEVSCALFMCDVALLVIDVVEGVCSQTEFLLREAISLDLDIILVLNKIDRLCTELKQTPAEAFAHLRRLIEQVNSFISQILSGTLVEEADWQEVDKTENNYHFDPSRSHVVFSSALHGYGFSLSDFAKLWSERLKVPEEELRKSLFTDCSFVKGTIRANADRRYQKSLFEQLILEPLWDVHNCGLVDGDLSKIKTFADKMHVTVKSRRPAEAFDEFMRNWLPLSEACLHAVKEAASPRLAFRRRGRLASLSIDDACHPLHNIVHACNENATTVVFVAKLVLISHRTLGVCRVLSGTVQANDVLFIIGSRNHVNSDDSSKKVTVKDVYMLMGRDIIAIKRAGAGMICGIEFDDNLVGCTLCSEYVSKGLQRSDRMSEPLVRVSIQCKGGSEGFDELLSGLKQMSMLDSSLRIIEQENGEIAMLTAGEVHLQKCLVDLAEMGYRNLTVSEPLVSFRETIIPPIPGLPSTNHKTECKLGNGSAFIAVRAVPIPNRFLEFLEKNVEILKELRRGQYEGSHIQNFRTVLLEDGVTWLKELKGTYWSKQNSAYIRSLLEHIWSFGPPSARLNLLINDVKDYERPSIWEKSTFRTRMFDQSIMAGFDLAMANGPLCDEPVYGVAIIVEEWNISDASRDDPSTAGALISAMKQTCRAALKKHPVRLMSAMYRCIVHTSSQALGKVHKVLAQRRVKITSEDMNQTSGLFVVDGFMPLIESFSLCEQLRKQTSGLASGQLEFSHWEIIDEDPFWEPTTEEEVELYGTKGDAVNRVKGYIDAVRKRKGLLVDEVIVANADKQRNLSRNK
ncbi:hypothetical protein AB6A40_001221 [Gnathostoma spinigerum]|uniref:Elongation factor 2 n=1 Tax=Gnathostoma spinigerum TaxID=75299 RepID=A0ABD6EDE0_9BILA